MLLNELKKLCAELNLEAMTLRQKAFNRVYEILNTFESKELEKVFSDNDDISWKKLFESAHSGVLINALKISSGKAEITENDSKITTYSKVMLKISDSPLNGKLN